MTEAPVNDGGNYNRLKVLVISREVDRRAKTVIVVINMVAA